MTLDLSRSGPEVSVDASCFAALEACTAGAGLEFDPVVARVALRQSEHEHPGDLTSTWSARLVTVGRDLGLRGVPGSLELRAVRDVASPETPVVTYRTSADGTENWWVVTGGRGRKLRLAALTSEEGRAGERWVTKSELAKLLGLSNARQPVEWVVFRPIAPCAGLAGPASHAHHGHGHGSGGGHAHMSPLRRLVGLIRPEARDIGSVVIYAIGVGILSLATPLAIEAVVTTVALNQLAQQLVVLSLVLLACLSIAAGLRALQGYLAEIIQRRLFVRVATDLSHRLPRVRADAFDQEYGPELVNRFFDVLTVQKVGALLLLDGVAIVLQTSIGLLILAFYHPYLLGFDIIVMAALTFVVFQLGRGAISTSIAESRAKYAVAGYLEELTRTPVAYKQASGPELALDRTELLTRRYLAARREHYGIVLRQVVFALGFQAIATTALLGLGGWLVIDGQLTLGQLVAADLIVVTVVGSFAKLGKHLEGWYDLLAAVDKLGHLVDLPLERHDGEAPLHSAQPATLSLRDLAYSYDGHHEVLGAVNYEVKSGERIAIVGPCGSGKSTLVDLIYGLRNPTLGHVELDRVNLRDLKLEAVRQHVAVVKGPEVTEGTVLENVRMGRGSIPLSQVCEALEAVGLLTELSALPDGLHTRLAANGAPLSPGQIRRLTIARVLAGKPRLLILDGSLDGLEPESVLRVTSALFDRQAPWTLLIVTNDPSVAKRCDRTLELGRQMPRSPGFPRLGFYPISEDRALGGV